jgi:hypothetical protein
MAGKRLTHRLEARVDTDTLLLLDRIAEHYHSTRSHAIRLAVILAARATEGRTDEDPDGLRTLSL